MRGILTYVILIQAQFIFGQGSMNIDSLYNWHDSDTIYEIHYSSYNKFNEVWGYARDGREYAILGSTQGTHFFDVTEPANSIEVDFVDGRPTGGSNAHFVIHRDYHDFDDYLYMISDEGSGLQIADLRYLPDSVHVVYDSWDVLVQAHNIFIDSSSARLYVCGGGGSLRVYSLANPLSPTLLVDCSEDLAFWDATVGWVHDVYVRNDTAYCNASSKGLFIIDFSDVSNPQMIGSLDTYVQQGYNHSGWLMPNAPFYALADETEGLDVKIIDVSDISNLVVTDTIGSDVNPQSMPHNLIYDDGFLYISYYQDGLYMFDCTTDPAHPTLAGFYDTSTQLHGLGYIGCWGVYPFLPSGNILASDTETGLWVFGHNLVASIPDKEMAQNTLLTFPNPVSEMLFVSERFNGNQYSIIDMSGREVSHGVIYDSLDVSELDSGIYTMLLNGVQYGLTQKFIKR